MQGDSLPLINARFNALRLEFNSNLNTLYGGIPLGKLKFYDIDGDYINYLKTFDHQVPNIYYSQYNKFFCGIVLQIDEFDYFAPVTSLRKQQRTNFLIYDKGRVISSIRFCFMIPAFDEVLSLCDFSKQPRTYQDLVNAEIKYCNKNVDKIYKKAKEVYKIGTNSKHPLYHTCCNFKLLEEKSLNYSSEIVTRQTAATNEKPTPE